MPSRFGPNRNSTSRNTQGFLDQLLAKLPYTHKIIDDISSLNPKYDDFHDLTKRKDERIAQQSVVVHDTPQDMDIGKGAIMINKDYHQYMYSNLDVDKIRRLQQYRRMAAYAEVSDAIDEICDETIVKDSEGNIVTIDIEGKYKDNIKKELKKEWQKFMTIFKLEDRGWEYFRQFLIDGELFFENVISQNRPEFGILGVVSIPSELINPVYDNVQNGLVKGYLLRRAAPEGKQGTQNQKEELIVFDKNQITYVHSGLWNEDRTIRIPYIENARRAYKQLSLIEDSIVIYRLVRAPERLVFYVDVGNMPAPKAEQYLQKLIRQYWSRKTYDVNGKSVQNVYDPQSMLDSLWFAKKQGQDGTKVETLAGGENLGQLDDLMYFVKKLYKSLKVPIGRLNPEDTFKDGTEITREELRFAKFVMRLQRQFAMSLKDSFIVHLKLRKFWEKYKLKEHELILTFNTPTQFMVMREQQAFNLKFENYNNMGNNELVSQSYAQRHYLDWTDDMMAENREWLRKDNELMWEIEQIRTNGPDFREKQGELEAAVGDIQGAVGGGAAVGAAQAELGKFRPDTPPEFGPGPAQPGMVAGGERPQATEAPRPT
jgi:hypothetical protein